MFNTDPKTLQRLAAGMQRVLIVDGEPASARLLADLLRDICLCQIWTAATAQRGLLIAQRIEPHLIFVGQQPGLDGAAFARDLRYGDFACRKAPVIIIAAEATTSAIVAARDCGAHEFLRRPFTVRDLMRRLEAVILRPRDWVEGVGYVGPDRRRFNCGDYSGPLKRRVDHAATPAGARIVQALKILKAALAAVETEPRQAHRAMLAQAHDLDAAAQVASDAALRAAAVALAERLGATDPGQLRRADVELLTTELWRHLPGETSVRSAA